MTDERAKEILEEAWSMEFDILEEVLPIYGSGRKTSAKSYRKSKLTKEQLCVKTEKNLYSGAWEKFAHREKGRGLPCMLAEEEENRLLLVGGSGYLHMNPAVVELLFSDTEVTMTAWAKEGLISQKTAKKALSACAEILQEETDKDKNDAG